jgi:hypothetical protein
MVPIRPFGRLDHTLTVSIGTPPQPRTLILDTGSDLIRTQCKLFDTREHQREPLYDPAKLSSFATAPCDGRLCETGSFNTKNCSRNKCIYTYNYGSAKTNGELASETSASTAESRSPSTSGAESSPPVVSPEPPAS